jgi:hypothetical protein
MHNIGLQNDLICVKLRKIESNLTGLTVHNRESNFLCVPVRSLVMLVHIINTNVSCVSVHNADSNINCVTVRNTETNLVLQCMRKRVIVICYVRTQVRILFSTFLITYVIEV